MVSNHNIFALIYKPKRIRNTTHKLFPDCTLLKGLKGGRAALTLEMSKKREPSAKVSAVIETLVPRWTLTTVVDYDRDRQLNVLRDVGSKRFNLITKSFVDSPVVRIKSGTPLFEDESRPAAGVATRWYSLLTYPCPPSLSPR
ncbi:hypothetical protein EVAR_16499_1 [Eumeta japonica]|uniref:Uncharacterized protein n=1 Tax=Eumeta variegata TaxID=151549 RepID=A0A4C1ULE7_EUMVA|nr:hypothetical protein EVAR_16499_1 [Eumeta japonica]